MDKDIVHPEQTDKVIDVGEWRGIKHDEWIERIMKGSSEEGVPSLRKGETLPWIKKNGEFK